MNDLEIDMDELEARLYGQVYHVSDSEDLTQTCEVRNDTSVKTIPRYFEEHSSKQQKQNYPIPPPFYVRMGLYPFSVMNPPVNNIVVLPSPPTQIFTKPQEDSQKWLEKVLKKYEKTRMRNKQKRARRKLRVKEQKNKEQQKLKEVGQTLTKEKKETPKIVDEVNEDSVLIVDDDSDGSANMSDVILVETQNDIISIDCDDMEGSGDVSTSQKDGLSPLKNKENCEVASSNSSTVDYTENFRGNKLLNDFNARINTSFSELNLDSFTNYIECNGKTSNGVSTLTKPLLEDVGQKRLSEKRAVENSSDSSSESEFEDGEVKNAVDDSIGDLPKFKPDSIEDNVISIDCEDSVDEAEDSPRKKKIKLDVIENMTEKLPDTRTSGIVGKGSDIIFIDDDNSTSSTELRLKESDRVVINSTKILNVEDGAADYPAKNQVNRGSNRFRDYWTEDMNKFYRESWGHEDFSVVEQQRQMSDNPSMWKIIPKDKINLNCLAKEPRCRRCREFGHIAVRCTKRLDPPKCILCGASGHWESRCPDKMCTSCGRKSHYFTTYCSGCSSTRKVTCSICTMKGHQFYNCPDLWRRYLFTTMEGTVVPQPGGASLKQSQDQWCSGCGGNGHFEQSCNYYNRTHLPSSVFIHDYSDIYSGQDSLNPMPASQHLTDSPTSPANKSFSWQLTPKEEMHLSLEGSTFLKTVEDVLKVKIRISNRDCYVTGSRLSKVRAKTAINRFCMNAELFRHMHIHNFSFKTECSRENLKENLICLENVTVNWRNFGNKIYNNIKSNRPKKEIEELYKQLNTVINAKLLLGDAKIHMRILKNCLNTDGEVIEESFRFIFSNGNEMTPNYGGLIGQLPCKVDNTDYSNYLEIERLKKNVQEVCDYSSYQNIENFYSLIIINNYSDSSVSKFKNAVWRMLSINPASKSGRRRKRDFQKNFLGKC